MGNTTAGNRNSCMLHGAVQTIKSIEGAVPIIHSTLGCGVQQYAGISSLSGGGGSGYTGGLGLPSTNFLERQVVFGGSSRLREQLKNTVKIKEGDFYVVLTGCTPELVGDDVPAMTKELQEQQFKAIHVSTPGFKGSVHNGYTAAVTGILRQFDKLAVPASVKNSRLVNLFGIIPEQDVYWRGNLKGLKDSLEGIGADVNVLFGPDADKGEWTTLFNAALNVSFSSHSLPICEWLERNAGIPYVHFDGYPVGALQTGEWLRCIGKQLDLDQEKVEAWIGLKEQKERYYIVQFLDAYYKYGFQKKFALVGDSAAVLGTARFLTDPLGLLPSLIVSTDDIPQPARSAIVRQWNERQPGSEARIVFESDAKAIEELVISEDIELLLGSSIERRAAERKGIPFIPVSFPVADRIVLTKGYAGFDGAFTLLEDLGSGILSVDSAHLLYQTDAGSEKNEQGADQKPALSGIEN
ncbi:nitrogenase component 1 [Paenibacillus sp. URB8-2]|uniref:nitrogenase component 1 n=1 Tax=Paenibacillus sp. URB8-2 TaxID=2741301 RepID=UPI0015C163C2|nr:nitrogenase component 1 [Paenibacillus sp. URB8-2]BCG61083.1 hydrogenase [Paenibacillus sp. URB8-2]